MSDLRELYQQVILDHYKRPRNFGKLENATCHADGHNPLCGDKVTVYVKLDGDVVADVHFEGSGCAISTASASMMTEYVKGKTRAEAEAIFQVFHDLLTTEPDPSKPEPELGKLAVFAGVREFPMRVKCATLVWHTMHAALDGSGNTVSTE
jgi:nitrogen fixation protein NifU and related proteins